MSITSDLDLIWLQKRAELCGCHCNRHEFADPTRPDLYLMVRRTQRNPHPSTLCKFATVEEVEECLTIVEEERLGRKRA